MAWLIPALPRPVAAEAFKQSLESELAEGAGLIRKILFLHLFIKDMGGFFFFFCDMVLFNFVFLYFFVFSGLLFCFTFYLYFVSCLR